VINVRSLEPDYESFHRKWLRRASFTLGNVSDCVSDGRNSQRVIKNQAGASYRHRCGQGESLQNKKVNVTHAVVMTRSNDRKEALRDFDFCDESPGQNDVQH
jgi:hypothetical protein